jgi:pseudouridine kinase
MSLARKGAAVVVIGGANIDHKSQTLGSAMSGTSNPGRSRTSLGGVGRNVAENLARLGVRVSLVTAIGRDAEGGWLARETEATGVDLSHSFRVDDTTGGYTAILDEQGELIIAVSSMHIMDLVTADTIAARAGLIRAAGILVLDCNICEEALLLAATIANEHGVPIVAEPVSAAKAGRISAMLEAGIRIHTITPNVDELRSLTRVEGRTAAGVQSAAERLHAAGVDNVWIRLGGNGSYLSTSSNGEMRHAQLEACPATLVDVTGAGDAMLAGYVAGLSRGLDPFAAATYGRAAAAMTVESEHTVSPSMNSAALAARVTDCAGSA